VLLVGCGDGSVSAWRSMGAAAARRSAGQGSLALVSPQDAAAARAVAEGAGLAAYRYTLASRPAAATRPVRRVDLYRAPPSAVAQAAATVDAVHLARDLANTPADTLTPGRFAALALEVGQAAGLAVTVRDPDWLREHGFGGLLGVGTGSANPPALVEIEYSGAPAADGAAGQPVVLAGKGITFDSGGLSLKPAEAMTSMKTDMSGAAAVLAVMAALPRAGVARRVHALLALAENLPSGSALRPGDVLRTHDGTTVEVINTDAEGRLVLADALGYAARTLGAGTIVDLATLTGAASVGLGRKQAALYASDDALAADLVDAADQVGERLWRMPLVDDYRDALDSDLADLCHVVRDRSVGAGSVTAALFLQAFTHGVAWAHLDMAGPARAEADAAEVSRGGTGYGVRLLLEWLSR
jgi:leucyl aminopeptidase